jgi:hypothetical protein
MTPAGHRGSGAQGHGDTEAGMQWHGGHVDAGPQAQGAETDTAGLKRSFTLQALVIRRR